MQAEKLTSIQILRAVAALAVVVSHTSPEVGWVDFYLNRPTTYPSFLVGAAGVDLFFVISGFVMVYSSGSYYGSARGAGRFFLRRLIRIVPLYWLGTGAILLSWWHIGTSFQQEGVGNANLVASLLFVPYPRPTGGSMHPILGVGWSLNYEMFFYVVFAATLVFRRTTATCLTIMALFATVYASRLLPLPDILTWYQNSDMLEFTLGMGIGLAHLKGVRIPRAFGWPLVIGGLVFVVISERYELIYLSRWLTWGVGSGAIVVGALALGNPERPGLVTRLMLLLGNASYSIYLFHGVLMNLPRYDFIDQVVWIAQSSWAYAAFLATFSVAGSVLIYVLVERPLTWVLRRVFTPPPRTTREIGKGVRAMRWKLADREQVAHWIPIYGSASAIVIALWMTLRNRPVAATVASGLALALLLLHHLAKALDRRWAPAPPVSETGSLPSEAQKDSAPSKGTGPDLEAAE